MLRTCKATQLRISSPLAKPSPNNFVVRSQTQRTYRTLLGTQEPHQVSIRELLGSDGGEPRFTSPIFSPADSITERSQLPIMIYIPGLDGTGLGAQKQLECLAKGFQLETFMIPVNDKRDFEQLLKIFTAYMQEMIEPQAKDRMIYVLGESFGALLALAGAHACKDFVDRIILINPATGYTSSIWSNVVPVLSMAPRQAYPLLSGFVAPLILNPIDVLFRNGDSAVPFPPRPDQVIENGLKMLGSLDAVADFVTEDVLRWKLQVVDQGIEFVDSFLHKIPQRTLVIASENDLLLPSPQEAERLKNLMLRAFTKILPGRSHWFMEDTNLDLLQVLKDEGFYVLERRTTSPAKSREGDKLSLNNFGSAAPIEIPSRREVKKLESVIEQSQTLSSPVFMSTLSNGSIIEGLDGIPDIRPLLFVGNHTLMALDMNILVHRILMDKEILVRGLAHPAVMNESVNRVKRSEDDEDLGLLGAVLTSLFNPRDAYKLYTLFGAVPVSAKNMYKLLSLGEHVLLYPGGAVEALKRRDEKYQIVWPDRSEFVRMGAKFGATVVTIASVGSEDGVYQALDLNDMQNNPAMKEPLQRLADMTPKARRGITASEEKMQDALLAPPFTVPAPPARQYYIFGKPVQLTPDLVSDKKKADDIYHQLKMELESNISYLIQKREEDPYKDFQRRFLYEAINRKQAPTFKLTPFLNDNK